MIFGMGIAKQWDGRMVEPPVYYLSNDSRCYYYSATDFLLAQCELRTDDRGIGLRYENIGEQDTPIAAEGKATYKSGSIGHGK
ncbi:MAG: hypothetical protein IKW79_01145 [Schwartzia sp.]|nr:hypothetical protein [Schwartzia sp. (in: firmicutes)]